MYIVDTFYVHKMYLVCIMGLSQILEILVCNGVLGVSPNKMRFVRQNAYLALVHEKDFYTIISPEG